MTCTPMSTRSTLRFGMLPCLKGCALSWLSLSHTSLRLLRRVRATGMLVSWLLLSVSTHRLVRSATPSGTTDSWLSCSQSSCKAVMPASSGGSRLRRLPSRLRISSSVRRPTDAGTVESWLPSSRSSLRADMLPISGGRLTSSLLERERRLSDVRSAASAWKTLSLLVARLRRCSEKRSLRDGGSESIVLSFACSSSSAVRLPTVRGMVGSLL
mmetsp:Transcript_34433/g.83795  ORF Transcript_34433/g.83795 Transcript_34433/m.83795 type:complete len:213 (-) Transcript_34433:1907-2545(-)